jgi:hypothetical protein
LVDLSHHTEQKSLFSKRIFAISDYDLSNENLRFFEKRGLLKKQIALIKEIPVYEITNVESYWNELSVTWNGVTNLFFRKDSLESFSDLEEKILIMLKEHQKNLEFAEMATLRKVDLISIIHVSIDIVDLLFDILISLHQKRINWEPLEGYSSNLKENLNLPLQTMDPLILDFSKVASAIKRQVPKETSEEVYSVLKSIYNYFESLKIEFDLKETHPNFQEARDIILAYYTLNDLLLGKVVDEKDNKKELHLLENVLQLLANNTNFKADIEALKAIINMEIPEKDLESFFEDTRGIFKQQLIQL